ncbi:flagellar basal body L-ring protein FlgH [Methylibium sp.]|uniref:flagellar basal body L-ring protein FlgH n=1 Tax=Methylibium sp. TaxID=2067992 RepID=UPI003D1145A8
MSLALLRVAALAPLAFLFGCQAMAPKVDIADTSPVLPQAVALPPVNNGAIFQGASYRPLFEDHRARLVGDTITVQIVEKVAASQQSTSSIDKTGSVNAGISALPFFAPNSFKRATATGSTEQAFEGKGTTASANTFSGTITATVVNVLPNGHLIITGEKQIGVNQHVDVLRFSGQVDPRAIQPGNAVASAQIANVRIEQRGRGAQAEAQGIGWLGRFFLNVLPL